MRRSVVRCSMEQHPDLAAALKGKDLCSWEAAMTVEYEATKILHQKEARIKDFETQLSLKEKQMDFQIQLRDGSWQEGNVLPENPSCYKKAILLDGSKEAMTLEPVMDQFGNYRWAVK